eukprot:CAMPEP_0179016898 /NCGR_PEP_ID=MMETSP0796-20121207/3564_1 /TAXON_ID=73915 /ORGANISM="Pyrodinium bahamense, Strain pbaha01" /LENGTH=292 /DNA_ID=CAMNT_0020712617 /DNA_START=1 /DNA_END=879 /DNA_ORIENTATION=+
MAAAVVAAVDGGETSGGEEATTSQRRRRGQQEVQEVVDELAQETKRTTLLERVEQQLKGMPHVSRLLFGFGMTDDKTIQATLEQEFLDWKEKQEKQSSGSLSGILLFMGQSAIHFLEGPTELLFGALEFFHSLALGAKPAAPGAPPALAAAAARPPLINPLRVLHFTELHGVRTSTSWCACISGGKSHGAQGQVDETNSSELTFATYRKFLLLSIKVAEVASGEELETERLQACYKKHADMMPTVDEVAVLLSKSGADYFFTYPEFEKVFVAPFHLVLHSELLWPMPPPLSY